MLIRFICALIFSALAFQANAQPVTTKPSFLDMLTANCSAVHMLLGGATSPTCGPTPTRAGDLMYYNGTNWVALAGNNAGTKVLQQDASGVPSWVVAAGSGTVTSSGSPVAGQIPKFTTATDITGFVLSITPQGRVTLTTAVPVLSSNVAGSTTVFYTPYKGQIVPIYDGTTMIPTVFAELSQATTDATKSPAAVAASKVYDIFVWNDAGTIRATRGPAWTNDTTRGYTLTMTNGILLNTSAITNGPAALRGTFVGTIRSNASSTIDFNTGSAASGGSEALINIWNVYNRVAAFADVRDNGASYTYASTTIRAARASNTNRVSFIRGLDEDAIFATYNQTAVPGAATGQVSVGIGLDTTSAFSSTAGTHNVPSQAVSFAVAYGVLPGLGYHFLQKCERSDALTTTFFPASGTSGEEALSVSIRY